MIAILSAGPSLEETWGKADKSQYRMTVGINRACWDIKDDLDYFSLVDFHAICTCITDNDRWPTKGFITRPGGVVPQWTKERHGPVRELERHYPWPDWSRRREANLGVCFSFPMILDWAARKRLDEEEIHVYGFDAVVDEEWDRNRNAGIDLKTGSHREARWAAELPWVALYWEPCMSRITPEKREVREFDRNYWLNRLPPSSSYDWFQTQEV